MQKRIILALVLVVTILSILLTSACSSGPAPTTPAKPTTPGATTPAATTPAATAAAKPVINVRFSTHTPANYPQALTVINPWKDRVEQLSKGRIKVTIYWGGVLASTQDAFDALVAGTADVAWIVPYLKGDRYPLSAALGLPGIGSGYFRGKAIAQAIAEKYPEIEAEYKAVKTLDEFNSTANAILMSKKPFKTLDQAKGQKLRSGSGVDAKALTAWGFVPVTIQATEGYEAIKTGLVDGMQFAATGQITYKIYELAKYAWANELVGNQGTHSWGASWSWYNKLDDEARLIVDYASTFMGDANQETYFRETQKAYPVFEKAGVTIYERDEADTKVWRDKIMFLWEEWEKDINKRFPNNLGTRIINDIKLEVFTRYGTRL